MKNEGQRRWRRRMKRRRRRRRRNDKEYIVCRSESLYEVKTQE